MADTRFADILLQEGLLGEADLNQAKKEAEESNTLLEEVLEYKGIASQKILKAKEQATGIPVKSLGGSKIPFDILKYVPEDSARHYQFVPLGMKEGVLEIGMLDPSDLGAREALQFIASKLNLPFRVYLISRADFNLVLEEYKGLGGEVSKVLGELESALAEESLALPTARPETQLVEDAPITKMVAVMLKHATEGHASDIHLEPSRDKLRVRFRVDGVLYNSFFLPMKVHDAIVARIKILTNMQLDEKRKPQDGRFSARIENREIDFRVSSFPTAFGEKVAIRILDPETGVQSLPNLGLEGRNLEVVGEELKRPYGLVLITGPTGSGKSTTLYAMLQMLNQERYNIVSLEDPIEYNIEGVNQSQVRPEINYDFASGLRSILRQDPDIIMVGEIRDKETAQLAIHAALTGHLVLSTLHTNSAIGVIPRLVDMGVDPYLIAPTLILAIAQRLVRTLCLESRRALEVAGPVRERLEKELKDIPEAARKRLKFPKAIYQALPSAACPKGTRGRIAVFEVLTMTPELEKIILKNPTEPEVLAEGRKQGMMLMREDGILKVLAGKVGLEELVEVV
ncbi:MAG: GspE/PulE family protein [bacterium]|nr:GspE/PulE family protein [bacterium]